jgi:hypothetical protein
MRRFSIAVAALGLVVAGCDGPTPTAPRPTIGGPLFAAGGNGVVHRVSVGSHDFLPPGTDANFSLIALEQGDGTMRGEWTDQFGHGNGGVHVDVDCVSVVDNDAWVSGVITHSTVEAFPAGSFALTRVRDNGTSENDPPDQISFTFIFANPVSCQLRPPLPLFPLQGGEVKVE